MARTYYVLLNPRSGTALSLGLTPAALKESFLKRGHEVTIDADDTAPFAERIATALKSDADTIVSAGGDGTATALGAAVAGTGKVLAVLPLGTANLLARDLKIPLDLEAAVEALDSMEPRQIDVGEVNGRIFLHKVVVGVIPSVAAVREQIRGRESIGTLFAFLRYFGRRLTRSRRIAVAITSRDTTDRVERVQALAVANNAYDEGFGRIFSRGCLDAGHLTLYTLRHLNVRDVLRLSAEMIAGRWQTDEALSIENVRSVNVDSRGDQISALLDGEVEMLSLPLRFRIRPLALTVLAPPAEAAVTAPAKDAPAASVAAR